MTYEELCESLMAIVSRIEDERKYSIEKIQINAKHRHYAGNYVNNPDQITKFMYYPCEFVDFSDNIHYCVCLNPVLLI